MIEYALAKLLMHWGIEPKTMIGHSIGEYIAATIAGVFGQGPIGYFSDLYDRRKVIVITTFASASLAFFSILASN